LSDQNDMYDKAKDEMRLSERIMAALPGWRGYKEKELRRESDKLIRNDLYLKLQKARSDLKEVFEELAQHSRLEALTDMDTLVTRYDRVAEKINHASYGYAGFFNVVKIDEPKLDKMTAFDTQLLTQVQAIMDEATAFKKDVENNMYAGAADHIQKTNSALESLEDAFDQRGEVILGVK